MNCHIHRAGHGPERDELIGSGRFKPDLVTSAVIGWDDAPKRFGDPAIRLVVARD